MKTFRLSGVLIALVLFASQLFSADPKAEEKNPGDRAYDAYKKLIEDKEARQDQSRIDELSQKGIEFVLTHPAHSKVGDVIDRMMRLKDQFKSKPALRGVFYSQVQSALLTPLFDDSLNADTKAAVLALDAAMAQGLFLSSPSNVTLSAWKEKIEAQLGKRSRGDLLKNRVAAYYEAVARMNPAGAEAFISGVVDNKDRNTATWAKAEQRFIAARKSPLALTFTSLEGKPVDTASFQGKVVCLFFWSASMPKLGEVINKLKDNEVLVGQKQFPVIAICVDPEADREKVLAAIKKEKIRWPVHFDGQGLDSELCKKLNVTATKDLPVTLLLDKKGVLAPTPTGKLTHDGNSVVGAARQLLAAKK